MVKTGMQVIGEFVLLDIFLFGFRMVDANGKCIQDIYIFFF